MIHEESMIMGASKVVDCPPQIRAGFVRKVYGLLTFEVLTTLLMSSLFLFQPDMYAFILYSEYGLGIRYFTLTLSILTFFALYCNYTHKYPENMICLILFTLSTSYQIAYTCACFKEANRQYDLYLALLTTFVIFLLLTLYVAITRHDLKRWNASLGLCSIVFLTYGIICMVFPIPLSRVLLGCFGTILFGLFILYDTSQLLHSLGPDDYVIANIHLYLDILNLFLSVLQCLDGTNE
jgi:FtsH-binding integral membrane protein